MSKFVHAGAAAAALLLLASPAAADPFELFKDICLDTRAERAAVIETFEKAGWVSVPATAFGDGSEGVGEPMAFVRSEDLHLADPAATEVGIIGWSAVDAFISLPEVRVEFCAVVHPGDKALMDRKMESLFAFPPIDINSEEVWIFSRDSSGYRPEGSLLDLSKEEFTRLTSDRQIYIAATISEDGSAITIVGAVRP